MAFKVKISINSLILFFRSVTFYMGHKLLRLSDEKKGGAFLQATFNYIRIEGPFEGKAEN